MFILLISVFGSIFQNNTETTTSYTHIYIAHNEHGTNVNALLCANIRGVVVTVYYRNNGHAALLRLS